MLKFAVAIDELAARRKILNAVDKKKDVAQQRVFEAGDVFEDKAHEFVAVDTGALRDSIDAKKRVGKRGPEVEVGAGEDYGKFQEFGTTRNRKHPFIRPALARAVAHLKMRVR